MRRRLTDLMQQRTAQLEAATNAMNAGDQAAYDSAMEKVRNLNTEIQRVQDLITETDRQIMAQPGPTGAEARDIAEERGRLLLNGDRIQFTNLEVRRALRDMVTVSTGAIVQPTGAGSAINDPLGNVVSSIVDMVRVEDLTGMGGYEEAYVKTETVANGGKVSTLAGTARAASTDPAFGVAAIKPYEVNVTQFVDRNIARLRPANYYAKVQGMAMRALRRKLAALIVNGDGQATPDMFGVKNAKNKAGENIFATANVTAIDENILDTLYFAYGSDAALGPNARLLLTKKDLQAIGKLRGTNEKRKLFTINPTPGDATSGTIVDGGLVLPYTIVPDLTSMSTSTQGASAIQTMCYGDPINYLLGLFGDYSVRVDESVKAVERMHTILGDVFVGGNLTVDKGFVVATMPAKA